MKKENLVLAILFLVLFLVPGESRSAPQAADAWLGTWDVAVKIDGCPGPGPEGIWPGTFLVTREGDRYVVKWLNNADGMDYKVEILSISGSILHALNSNEPVQNEWNLTLQAGGQKAEGSIQQRKPYGGAQDPCRRGNMVATRRGSPTQKPPEKKEEPARFWCEIIKAQVARREVFVEGRAYGGSSNYVFSWDFGDISSSAASEPANYHEYECPGKYRIRLVVQDITRHVECYCDKIIQIVVPPIELPVSFSWTPIVGSYPDPHGDYYVEFQCPQPVGGIPPSSFHWDFGDDRRHIPDTYSNPVIHYYWNPGIYRVELTVYDSCHEKLGPIYQDVKIGEEKPIAAGALIVNGDFSSGLYGWSQSASGYGGSLSPSSQSLYPPSATSGYLEMGVFGGTRQVYQDVQASLLNLRFRARCKVERWSTYYGTPGGWMAIGIIFLGPSGKALATTYYYACPTEPFSSQPGLRWVALGTNLASPSGWMTVDAYIEQEAIAHGLQPGSVTGIRIVNIVFGTHEDQTPTIARFDDLSLTPLPNWPRSRSSCRTLVNLNKTTHFFSLFSALQIPF